MTSLIINEVINIYEVIGTELFKPFVVFVAAVAVVVVAAVGIGMNYPVIKALKGKMKPIT